MAKIGVGEDGQRGARRGGKNATCLSGLGLSLCWRSMRSTVPSGPDLKRRPGSWPEPQELRDGTIS